MYIRRFAPADADAVVRVSELATRITSGAVYDAAFVEEMVAQPVDDQQDDHRPFARSNLARRPGRVAVMQPVAQAAGQAVKPVCAVIRQDGGGRERKLDIERGEHGVLHRSG